MFNALLWNVPLTAALAIVLAALCRLPSMHKRPALRHLLWLLLLAKLITPPLIGVPLFPAVARSDDAAAIATPPGVPTVHRESASDQRTQVNSAVADTTSTSVNEGAGRDADGVTYRELRSGTPLPYLGGLLAASLIGTCVLLTVHGLHAAKLYRWLKRAGSQDSSLAESCADVASSLEIRGLVRSCVVDARMAPLLWPWHRPLVVMPRQLIDELGPQQLRSIVAHELAHYLRRDHWANVFAFVVKVLLWWNPVVWWANRELRAAQELCCDAIAIDRCKANRRGYATTLLKALDLIQAEPWASRELALELGSRRSILRRFEMIGETQLSYRLSRWTLLLLLVLAIPLVCFPVRGQEEGPTLLNEGTAPRGLAEDTATTEAPADAKQETPSVEEIVSKVLEERNSITSGIVSFQVKTKVDLRQPVAEKVVMDYTVYFSDGNFRMDEVRHLVSGKVAKYWRVYAFDRCLHSYNEEDAILINTAGERGYNDLGIINPLQLGLSSRRTVAMADKPDIVSRDWPQRAKSVVENEVLNGVDTWKVTTTWDNYRITYWVAPQMKFSIMKYVAYADDRVLREVLCRPKVYEGGQELFFPMEVVIRRFGDQGEVVAEEVTSVLEAKFNVDVPDDVFAMEALGIPPGRKVLDFIGGSRALVWDGEMLVDRVGSKYSADRKAP